MGDEHAAARELQEGRQHGGDAGRGATIVSVMPVSTAMNGGIGSPGLTSVWNSPRTSPPRTFTAPISVMLDEPGEPPVVSRSTTTKVTSAQRGAELVEGALDGGRKAGGAHTPDGRAAGRQFGDATRRPVDAAKSVSGAS